MVRLFALALGASLLAAYPLAARAGNLPDTSLNNVSSYALEAGQATIDLGGRYFGSGDFAWSASTQLGIGAGFQASVAFNSFEADNDDTLGTDWVTSRWNGFELAIKKNLIDNEEGALGVQVEAELRNSKTIIETTRVSTVDSSTVWSFAIPVAWNARDNVQVQGTLKTAFFPGDLRNSEGATVEGFGTLIGATLGAAITLTDQLSIAGDATAILTGDNSITDDTGNPGDQVTWSASAIWHATDRVRAEAFLTNSGGTSVVTSLLGASGTDSVFAGLRFGYSF
ncbi:MAG: hypothetical protein D6815_10065 [Candidatus Dadabacteria bacterium]|nr:MAG: hypothetical protein D6815_10065 [Candidatus Dadabacteria bacterium]